MFRCSPFPTRVILYIQNHSSYSFSLATLASEMIKAAQDAGHLVASKNPFRLLALLVLASLFISACNGIKQIPRDNPIDSTSIPVSYHTLDRVSYRITLRKRSPLPQPDTFAETFPDLTPALLHPSLQTISRPVAIPMLDRYQTLYAKASSSPQEKRPHPKQVELDFSHRDKEKLLPLEMTKKPEARISILEALDKKRKNANLEYQEKVENLKKAKMERDAVQNWKPQVKQQRGERVSRLTMKNIGVAKATVLKNFNKVKAKQYDKEFQKVKSITEEVGIAG